MKKFFALLLCLSVMTVATACGSKEEAPAEPETQVESSATVDDSTAPETEEEVAEDADTAETEDVTEDAAEAAEATFTGTLEEKKDFMIVVSAEDQSYAFNLADGVECAAEVGEEITVTYTGDIEAPEADQDLTATQITVAE